LNTSDPGTQPPTPVQLTLPAWIPGGELTPLEEEMRAQAAAGELVDPGAGPFDLAEMQAWGEERAVRADVLQYLLVDGEWPVATKGVRLRGARISGPLDLEAAALRCPLSLDYCYLDANQPVSLDHATVSLVMLTRCQLAGLTGDLLTGRRLDLNGSTLGGPLRLLGAAIAGELSCRGTQLTGTDSAGNALVADRLRVGAAFFDGGFTAAGAVRLMDANITGQLGCRGAHLTGRDSDGYSLVADRLKAGGGVYLDGGFTAAGAIGLLGADITGELNCGGAHLAGTDTDGNALFADWLKASGRVYLGGRFTAAGAVRLLEAEIAGELSCRGTQLTGTDTDGDALVADRLKVGATFLDGGFTAAGAVRLMDANITGQLSCRGAHLTGHNHDGDSLVAERVKVSGDVLLDGGFTAAGTISLASAHISASASLRPTALADENKVALDAARAQIAGTLRWAPAAQVSGQVNLEGASVGHLDDDWSGERRNGYWPVGGQLRLDGFTYRRFGGNQQATVGQRLDWIRNQYQGDNPGAFATQPYEQLAAVYRQAGQDSEARKVAIARRADLRKYGNLNWYRRLGNMAGRRGAGRRLRHLRVVVPARPAAPADGTRGRYQRRSAPGAVCDHVHQQLPVLLPGRLRGRHGHPDHQRPPGRQLGPE
jgi:hypothetical protein